MTDRSHLLSELFAAIDAMDTRKFLGKLSSAAVFRFGSAPAVQGQDAIGTKVDDFFSTLAGINHQLEWQVSDGPIIACEGTVTYTRHDGSAITLPFANFFELDGDLISGYRVYVDIAPLYASDS